MAVLKNRAKMSTSSTGTGTITLGSAETGYQSFADAGVANSDVVRYVIEDGNDWEIGTGTYTSSGTTLSRAVSESSNSGAALNLSGSATVFITAAAEDLPNLYADNPVSAVAPTASGNNAVAIGEESTASGTDSISLGSDSDATQNESSALGKFAQATGSGSVSLGARSVASGQFSVALGGYTDATSTNSIAIGYPAQAVTGSGATAIGNSYASGTDSFAAAIATNSSSYGATGSNSVAIGREAKAVASDSLALGWASQTSGNGRAIAIGYLTHASDFGATALGYDNDASGSYSTAIGRSTNVSGDNSVGIGYQAGTSVNNQVVLGGTTQQVKISNTYTLPTADGTNGQVLTTDGSGAVTFADAGGGGGSPDLFAENYDGTSTLPSATGTNALSLAPLSTSTGINSVSIGSSADATGNQAFSFGVNSTASGLRGISFGSSSFTNNTDAVAIGSSAQAHSVGGLALGHDAMVITGAQAVAIGDSYASGADSFAAAIANNSSTYGASGANSIAIGSQAKATGGSAVALNYAAIASGYGSVSTGQNSNASASYSTVIGGRYGEANEKSKVTFGGGNWLNDGGTVNLAHQTGLFNLAGFTTDGTAKALTTYDSTASSDNQVVLPNNSAFTFTGTIIAREKASEGSDYSSWEIKGALLRDANAGSTVLGNGIVNSLYHTSGASAWAIALSADTTNGGLKVQVTGAASTNIRWAATVNTSEVIYA